MTKQTIFPILLATSLLLQGCGNSSSGDALNIIEDNYRTTYEIFVYSFADSNNDGIGDLQGIINQLDYINDGDDATDSDLGCNGLWLTPVCPSTTYHKYDIYDYTSIDEEFGTLEDYEALIKACHERHMTVTFDFVMNHTSSEHPWFKEATSYLASLPEDATAEDFDESVCPYVNYYNFSKEAKEGYEKLENCNWYYEARFWKGMPDVNLDNEAVRNEFFEIAKFWMDEGVDNFRLDAVTSYYTGNPEKNIEVLTWLNNAIKSYKEDAYIVGECWSSQSEYASYYESNIDSFFDFAFADKDGIIAQCAKGSIPASSFGKALEKEEALYASYNEDYVNAPFYTNHDINRSAGYYSGENVQAKIKFAGGLNMIMSGNAYLYYGEEIGMKGSGSDENKRAPMQWTADESAEYMCDGPENMDDVEMLYGTLEEQEGDSDSIYNYYKAAIRLRNTYPVIARGTTSYLGDCNTEGLCVLSKSSNEYEGVTIVVNNTDSELSGDISEYIQADASISYELLANNPEEHASLNHGTITIPSYGIIIVK
ncbi:MAG: alpha-amylase [Lachnospiraceae bacterium]|nr:alpha-amylase [Lachnospiraceae bacterium]